MRHVFLIAITLPLLTTPVRSVPGQQPQLQTGSIAGRVVDPSGGVLPGVTIVATGQGQSRKVISDRNGAYRIDELPSGPYRVQADLAGFRWAIAESVAVTVRETTTHDIRMRLGIVSPDLYVIPSGGVLGALREADVVVHLEIVASLGSRLRHNESTIATEHRAKVLTVVKADQPTLVGGSEIAFDQEGAGAWTENGQRFTGLHRPYGAGSTFVAFLRRNPDGTLVEFRGQAFMFPVSKGVTILNYAEGAAASGLRANMPVEECLAVLRKTLAGGV